MATGKSATINAGSVSAERLVQRLQRIRLSKETATGGRLASLEAEDARIVSELQAKRAEIEAVLAAVAPG